MPKFDTKSLLQDVNLVNVITSDLGDPVKVSGRYTFFHCPFHADNDPSFAVTPDRYYCFGCRASGDAIKWLMGYRKLTFRDACEVLSPSGVKNVRQSQPINLTETITARQNKQPDDYQASWKAIIDECQSLLWSDQGKKARDYLHGRGLNDKTLRSPFFRVGYSDGRRIADTWVERGIVLPCFSVDQDSQVSYVDYIKIRHSKGVMPKYRKLKGGRKGLYGADTVRGSDIVIVTEGEFDCLLLNQEAGDLVGVCTLGSATDRFDWGRYGRYIGFVKWILIAYDIDDAGDLGAEAWKEVSGRVKRIKIPDGTGKDITDAWKSGVNLSDWVMDVLRENGL